MAQVWPRITSLAKKHPSECLAAVAFIGQRAHELLPLTRGSILVVNMSERSVQHGLTNPYEVEKFMQRGVEVHTVANLHAKVFVFRDRAIVGSMNTSRSSANELIEAALEVTGKGPVASSKRFVRSLCGERVSPEYVQAMQELYHFPSTEGRENQSVKAVAAIASHQRLWLVRVQELPWDDEDDRAERAGMPIAEERLSSEEQFEVEDFRWSGGRFQKGAEENEFVAEISSHDGQLYVYPPSRILYLHRYVKASGSECMMVFVEADRSLDACTLDYAIKRLGFKARDWRTVKSARRITDPRLRHALLNLWYR